MKRIVFILIVLSIRCNHPVTKNNIPLYKMVVSFMEKMVGTFNGTGTGTTGSTSSFSIAYSGTPYTFTKETAISTITPTVNGTITSCAASPDLPSGLVLSATCAISGTPSLESSKKSYTITATNSGGTTQATIQINIRICYDWGCFEDKGDGTVQFTGIAGTFGGNAYTAQSLTFLKCSQGQTWNSTTNSCDGTAGTYQYCSAADNSCNSVGNEYSSWTLNGTGTSSAYTSCNSIGTFAGYTGWRVPTKNELKTLVNCANKSMPLDTNYCGDGNYLSPAINKIFLNTQSNYYYWSSNTFSSITNAAWDISFNHDNVSYSSKITSSNIRCIQTPFTYPNSPFLFGKSKGIDFTILPTVTGTVTSYSISPSLPSGLIFNTSTGAITGTPTPTQNATSYVVTANTANGSLVTTISIKISDYDTTSPYTTTGICYSWGCFKDNMDGTIAFEGAGSKYGNVNLTWMKCSQGQTWNSGSNDCSGPIDFYKYCSTNDNNCNSDGSGNPPWTLNGTGISSAYTSCDSIGTFAGYIGWRVPSKDELKALINCNDKTMSIDFSYCGDGNYTSPTINNLFAASTSPVYYLSSTTSNTNNGYAWVVSFSDGIRGFYPKNSAATRLRCVK
jgi:hypothetical protein